jgi:hypothetical protein
MKLMCPTCSESLIEHFDKAGEWAKPECGFPVVVPAPMIMAQVMFAGRAPITGAERHLPVFTPFTLRRSPRKRHFLKEPKDYKKIEDWLGQGHNKRVFTLLRSAGREGLTNEEITERSGIKGNSLGFTIKALRDKGLLETKKLKGKE